MYIYIYHILWILFVVVSFFLFNNTIYNFPVWVCCGADSYINSNRDGVFMIQSAPNGTLDAVASTTHNCVACVWAIGDRIINRATKIRDESRIIWLNYFPIDIFAEKRLSTNQQSNRMETHKIICWVCVLSSIFCTVIPSIYISPSISVCVWIVVVAVCIICTDVTAGDEWQ